MAFVTTLSILLVRILCFKLATVETKKHSVKNHTSVQQTNGESHMAYVMLKINEIISMHVIQG